MKRIYMIPELQIVEIHCETLIAESLGVNPEQQVNTNFTKDEGDWDEVWDD